MTNHFSQKKGAILILKFLSVSTIINFYKRMRFEVRRIIFNIRNLFRRYKIADPDKVYWIDPELIIYHTNHFYNDSLEPKDRVFDMISDKGCVYDGDWDISNYKFSDLEVFKAFQQRMINGKSWQETEFYKNELAHIEAGKKSWGCRNRTDWDERCKSLDLLIESVKKNGYLSDFQLFSEDGKAYPFFREEMIDQVTVNIGRNGEYLFQDGRHRLSIAKILGIKKIPVKVLVQHKKWYETKKNQVNEI